MSGMAVIAVGRVGAYGVGKAAVLRMISFVSGNAARDLLAQPGR